MVVVVIDVIVVVVVVDCSVTGSVTCASLCCGRMCARLRFNDTRRLVDVLPALQGVVGVAIVFARIVVAEIN